MSPTGRKHAFTLLECIVVMLTTIMLASIVIPALFLGKAKEKPVEFELKPIYEESARDAPTPELGVFPAPERDPQDNS